VSRDIIWPLTCEHDSFYARVIMTRGTRSLLWLAVLIGCTGNDGNDSGNGNANGSEDTGADGSTAQSSDSATTSESCGVGGMTSSGDNNSVMQTWGAACTTPDECVALLGTGVECLNMAVIYPLPGGYCSKKCELPNMTTTVVKNAPDCAAAGGVDCIGQMGIFSQCAVPCTDDQQCDREGYTCRRMPTICKEDDPTYCLMRDA